MEGIQTYKINKFGQLWLTWKELCFFTNGYFHRYSGGQHGNKVPCARDSIATRKWTAEQVTYVQKCHWYWYNTCSYAVLTASKKNSFLFVLILSGTVHSTTEQSKRVATSLYIKIRSMWPTSLHTTVYKKTSRLKSFKLCFQSLLLPYNWLNPIQVLSYLGYNFIHS